MAWRARKSCGSDLSARTPVACRETQCDKHESCLIHRSHTALIGHLNPHAPTLSARSSGGRETRLPAVGTGGAGLTAGNTGHTRQRGESSSRTQLWLRRGFNCREKEEKSLSGDSFFPPPFPSPLHTLFRALRQGRRAHQRTRRQPPDPRRSSQKDTR